MHTSNCLDYCNFGLRKIIFNKFYSREKITSFIDIYKKIDILSFSNVKDLK